MGQAHALPASLDHFPLGSVLLLKAFPTNLVILKQVGSGLGVQPLGDEAVEPLVV